MDHILVLYRSKYGATKRYAELLKEKLACDILDARSFQKDMAARYECFIFAGAIYASGISGMDVLRKNYPYIRDKKIAVLCVGASPYDDKAIEDVRKNNLKELSGKIPLFYARGAWDESRMTFKDRTLCKLLQKMINGKDPNICEPWMKALLAASGKKCDWVDEKYLGPLIENIAD